MSPDGPVVVGFDGSPAARHALERAAALVAPRPALVVCVWEPGLAYAALEVPVTDFAMPPPLVEPEAAEEVDEAVRQRAEGVARAGAELARSHGLAAEHLAVADDTDVARTLARVAREHDAQAIVVGTHGHGGLRSRLLGDTSQAVAHHAPCPVVMVHLPGG